MLHVFGSQIKGPPIFSIVCRDNGSMTLFRLALASPCMLGLPCLINFFYYYFLICLVMLGKIILESLKNEISKNLLIYYLNILNKFTVNYFFNHMIL
jgi:hypothetical protein